MYNNFIITNNNNPTINYAQLEPLEVLTRELALGLTFSQETLFLNNKRFTNFYWLEFDKRKFGFELISSDLPMPLKNYDIPNKKVVAGINFGSFFLSDDLIIPKVAYYNLLIRDGEIIQFPSNNRPSLITSNGKLSHALFQAQGTLKLGNKTLSWSGSHNHKDTDLIAFGMFDLTITKTTINNTTRRKVIIKTKMIDCPDGKQLLGFSLSGDKPVLSIVSQSQLNLTDYCFILMDDKKGLENVQVGDMITNLTIKAQAFDKNNQLCSASFSLGHTKEKLTSNLKNQLIYPQGGRPKPLLNDYLKSWSTVLETKEKVVFFINDARPKIDGQQGLSVFELQDVIRSKFNYLWACVGDSGQSSKLMTKSDTTLIYGNMHYQNYKNNPPTWDGENGRPVPVALLAYE